MPYQKPKSSHPWYGKYATGNRKKTVAKKDQSRKSPKIFIREIAESWDNIEIYTYSWDKERKYSLDELPHSKQAAWLAGLLKKAYGDR